MSAYLFFARQRRRRESAEALSHQAILASGKPEAVKNLIEKLNKPAAPGWEDP